MNTALAPFKDYDGNLVQTSNYAIDVIGQIVIPAVVDILTLVVIEAAITKPGWHVNWTGELPTSLAQYEVFPETPYRVNL